MNGLATRAVRRPASEEERGMKSSTLVPPTRKAPGGGGQRTPPPATASVEAASRVLPPGGYQPFALELLRITDAFIAGAILVAVFIGVNVDNLPVALTDFLLMRVSVKNLLLMCGFIALWQSLFSVAGLYDSRVTRFRRDELKRLAVACTLGSLVVLAISLAGFSDVFPAYSAAYYLFPVFGSIALTRALMREISIRTRSSAPKEVIIVGSGPRAYKLLRDLEGVPDSGYQLLGFVDSNDDVDLDEIRERLIGRLEDLEGLLMRHPIDEVLIALPIRSCYSRIEDVIRTCERVGVESKYFADVFENDFARPAYDAAGDVGTVSLKVVHDDARLLVKRAFDIAAATIALVVLSPLMALIALGIKLTSPGPVIFSQWRYGRNRRLFKMYKFRTMVPDAETLQVTLEHLNELGGPVFKIADDPRVTPFGRFLRRTSLDELPQLVNVLRGEMSFVGPRPLPTRDVSRFNEGRLMRRFSVVPGLTCLWQISGRNQIGFDEWLRLDLEYIDNWSLKLDVLILLRTFPAVIRGTGAQ